MPEKNKQKFFIDWILDNSQKDNGFSAKMRRADNPDQEYYALGILCGFDIDIEKESERLPYSVVGAALCRAQVESDGSLGLGEALRICESLKASESGEKNSDIDSPRLRRLLSCNSIQELCRSLRPVFSLIASRNISLCYSKLLEDICRFQYDNARQNIKLRWTREFFRRSTDESATEEDK